MQWKITWQGHWRLVTTENHKQPSDEDFEQAESQGEEAPCQGKEAAAGPPEKSTGDDDATPPAYPSIWTKDQYEQFKSKNEWW